MGFYRRFTLVAALITVLLVAFGLPGFAQTADDGSASTVETEAPAPPPLTKTELPELRTRTSRTYAMPDGSRVAEISATPVNYLDGDGAWEPIDNTLVPSSDPGYAFENKANAFTAQFPADLSSAPIRFKLGDDWVSFGLEGTTARAAVSGSTVTYADVVRGVDLQYSVLADSLKESLILRSPSAVAAAMAVRFRIETRAGLEASSDPDGGIDFVNQSGGTEFSFRPPFMQDASGTESGFSEAVSFAFESGGSGLSIGFLPDTDWLSDPARRWPVVIDPSVTPSLEPSLDCMISSAAPGSQYCGSTRVRAGRASDGTKRRTLIKFDLSAVPQTSQVQSAKVGLYLVSQSTTAGAEYRLHRVTRSWISGVTWNEYDGTRVWSKAGGDFDTAVSAVTNIPGSASAGFQYWYPTSLVQDWVDKTKSNYGMLLKQATEGVTNVPAFASTEDTDPSHVPSLEVTYGDGTGELKYYTFETQSLNDRMQIKGNVATGNLLLRASELNISGTAGHDLSVGRFFNSLSTEDGAFGRGWVMSVGHDVKVQEQSNGDVVYFGPSGFRVSFEKVGSSYEPPNGVDGTLTKETDGTWTLEFHSKDKYRFDSSGRLTAQKDKNDNAIAFTYNADATLSTITDTHNRTVSFTYDSSKRVTKMVDDAGGRTYTYVYGPDGRLSDYYDPENVPTNSSARSTHFVYDGNGLLTEVTTPEGRITRIGYEAGKRKVASITRVTKDTTDTDPKTTFSYDTTANKTTVQDPRNNPTTYTWEEKGRVTNVKDAKGNSRSTSYTSRSNVLTYTEAGGITSPFSFSYNGTDDVVGVTLPTGGSATINYGEAGTTLGSSATPPAHFPTSIFDFQNRATVQKSGTTGYDPNKASYRYEYDDRGNLISATDGLGNTFTYDYNDNGTLNWIKDAKGNVTNFVYFSNGDLQTIAPPSPMGATRLTYDAVSRIKTATDGANHVATFTYDKLDRVILISYSDGGFVSYDYDLDGNLESRKDDTGGTINFTYDDLNRLIKETPPPPQGVNTYAYDLAGNITLVSDQSGETRYTYDSVNMVTSVTDPNNAKTTFSYDDPRDTFRTKTVYPNGVTISVTPEPKGSTRIKEIKATNAANQVLTKFSYTYAVGTKDTALRQSVTDKFGVKTTYTYDAVNRLTKADQSDTTAVDYAYAYDPNSNLISKTLLGGTPTTLSYNAANQLTKAGSVTYDYDGAGNLISNSLGFRASYNAKNQTIAMTPPGGDPVPMTYQDASQDKRIKASLTEFDYTVLGLSVQRDKGLNSGNNTFVDPDNMKQLALEKFDEAVKEVTQLTQTNESSQTEASSVEAAALTTETETSGLQTDSGSAPTTTSSAQNQPTDNVSSSVNRSTFWTRDNMGTLVSQRSEKGTSYYLFDGLGSVVGLTDSSGAPVATYKYDPYGKQVNAKQPVDNPWGFVSGYTDPPTGFVKFGTRYYDPTIMRWTQVDPEKGQLKNPVSLNAYQYAGGNPTNHSDRSGTAYCNINIDLLVYNIGWYADPTCLSGFRFYAGPAGGTPGGSVMWGPGKPSCESAGISGGYWLGGAGGTTDEGRTWWELGFTTPGLAVSSNRAQGFC